MPFTKNTRGWFSAFKIKIMNAHRKVAINKANLLFVNILKLQ